MSRSSAPAQPSRRRLLAGSGIAATLGAIGLPVAASATPTDPVLAIYARWLAVEGKLAVADGQHTEMRQSLVTIYGEPLDGVCDYAAWRADPRHPAFQQITGEVNDLSDASTDLVDALMATPATSLEGLRCKFIVALDVWKFLDLPNVEAEYHDDMTVAFLRDAVRLLDGSNVA